MGVQGSSFQPNGPYFVRESQGNEESQVPCRGIYNQGIIRNSQGDRMGILEQAQLQYCQKQGNEMQDGEVQGQISEMSEDNNYTSRSRSVTSQFGEDSGGERIKLTQPLTSDEQPRNLNVCEEAEDEMTLQERIDRKHEKLRGKINQFYERDNNYPVKDSPASSHIRFKEQAELNRKSKQKKSGVMPSQYSRHSGPLLKGLVSENSCQNLTLQQSPDSNKLDVDNMQFHNLNRSSNNEIVAVDHSNYRAELPPSQQQNLVQRQSDASQTGTITNTNTGGAPFNPADDRPIRPSSIQRMFGHPEDHGLGAFHGAKDVSAGLPPSQREKEKSAGLGKNLLLVKKRIDLNDDDGSVDVVAPGGMGHRDSFFNSKRGKQQSLSKLNSSGQHAGPRLYSQQFMAQGAESSKNLESLTRCQAAVGKRNTLGRTSPAKAFAQMSRSKGRDSSSSLRPMATTLYTKLLSSQNCESLTAQPRIDRIDINANQKMKKMNKNLQGKQQNRSPSTLSKLGHHSTQAASKQQTTAKTVKTQAQIKKINMEKLLPVKNNKLQSPQTLIIPMNTDRTHQQTSTILSLGEKKAGGAVDRQRSGVLHKEFDLIGKNNYGKQSGRLTGQDALNGASIHNYLLKKASIDISSSCMTPSERSKRSLQKGKQNSESGQKVTFTDLRQGQLSDEKKVYKKVSSKYNIKRSPKLQEKRSAQVSGHSPSNAKYAQHTLQTMEHENTDMEDYGSSCIVVNKVKSPMMTHTDKNKFNKKANPGGTQSRNNNQAPNSSSRQINPLLFSEGTNTIQTVQKSRKDLGQAQPNKPQGASMKTSLVPATTTKDPDRQKRERNAMNLALQGTGTAQQFKKITPRKLNQQTNLENCFMGHHQAQLLKEINSSAKKPMQKSKPLNNGIKTIPNSTVNNNNMPLQHSKSNQLASMNSTKNYDTKLRFEAINQKQTQKDGGVPGHQGHRHSEKQTHETLLSKKHSNMQIKIDQSINAGQLSYTTISQSPMQYGKQHGHLTCSNKVSQNMSVVTGLNNQTKPSIQLSTKNSKQNIIIPTRQSAQTMTPKGQKQVTRLLKAQKNQCVDHQATVDEKDLMEEEVLSAGAAGQGVEAMNTFMKAKTYKDLKEKMEQNLKQQRLSEQKKGYLSTTSNKASGVQQQVANNEQRKKLTVKKDTSPIKLSGGAQHSGNNQDPPSYQQIRQKKKDNIVELLLRENKLTRGQNKVTTESTVHLTRNQPLKSNINNQEQQFDNQSQKRSILSSQASKCLNQAQTTSKNQSPARYAGNRTSQVVQEDVLQYIEAQKDNLGIHHSQITVSNPSPPGLAVNFGQLISGSQQNYGQQMQMTALTQRVSMPLNDRKNLYLSDSQMMLLEQQQNSQQSILKKNRSSKSPVILNFSQRDSQTHRQSLHEQEQQTMMIGGQQSFGQHISQQFQTIGPRSSAKTKLNILQQNLLSNITLSATAPAPGQIPSQRRDRSLTEHLPDFAPSKGKYQFDREAQNSSRNPNRVRFQESLKDLKSHRSLRHANMSVTSGGGQSGGNLSQYRELTNLNHLRDQKKISKSIQQGRHQGRFGSQQSDKAPEETMGFNDINSKNDGDLGHLEDQLGEKMKDIQEQLSRMNELSVERKNSSSRRRLRSNSFQRPNMLENQIGTLKASSQHSTSLRDIFQQQNQHTLTYQNLVSNSSTVRLPMTAHHNRLNSMQYPVATSQNIDSRQRYSKQDNLNLSQEAIYQRQPAQEVKDQGVTVGILSPINPNLNFNSTTKKVMIDLSIQGAMPSHLGTQLPTDPQQSAQNIRKFRPQMGQAYSSHQQPCFNMLQNQPLTISTGSGEFELQNPSGNSPQFAPNIQNQNLGQQNLHEIQHQIVPGRQMQQPIMKNSAQDFCVANFTNIMSPNDSQQFQPNQIKLMSPTTPQSAGFGMHSGTMPGMGLGSGARFNRDLSVRSSNSSPHKPMQLAHGPLGKNTQQISGTETALQQLQPRNSRSRKKMQQENSIGKHQQITPQQNQQKGIIVPHGANSKLMIHDLLANPVTSYQPLNTQVFPDDGLDKEKDLIIGVYENNTGYYSASGDAVKKRGERQIRKVGHTSKSSLQTQKKKHDLNNLAVSVASQNLNDNILNSTSKLNSSLTHQKTKNWVNQTLNTQQPSTGLNQRLFTTASNQEVINLNLDSAYASDQQQPWPPHQPHQAHLQQSARNTHLQQQPSAGVETQLSSGGLGRASLGKQQQLLEQADTNQNAQSSECYLSSACHGSQQSLSSKKQNNIQTGLNQRKGPDGKSYIFFGK